MNRCDICLKEECEGKRDCKCESCALKIKCPRKLHPTIRITNRCTQKCAHCGFSSSPSSSLMMTVEQSRIVSQFLKTNEISYINVMGGEFFCNPDWEAILENLIEPIEIMRLVTNGDWATNSDKVMEFFRKHKNKLVVAVSGDHWHTRKNIEEAERLLKENEIPHKVSTDEDMPERGIVPVGRGELIGYSGFYGSLTAYCSKPEAMYSFLIDEEGNIYKCVWGMLKYANVKDYIDKTFYDRFKKFNQKFYGLPVILTCSKCYRTLSREKDLCVKK